MRTQKNGRMTRNTEVLVTNETDEAQASKETTMKTEVRTKAPPEGREREPIDQSNWSIMTMRRTLLLTLAGLATLVGSPSWAITGTAADTNIVNDVTLSYAVGTVAQDDIEASADFEVDRKFDVVVAAVATTYPTTVTANGVAPGTTEAVLLFTVTNQSNFDPDMLIEAFENEEGIDPFAGTIDNIINQDHGSAVSSLSTTVGTVNGYQYNTDEGATSCASELTAGADGGYIPASVWNADNDALLVCIYVDIPLTSDLTASGTSVDDGDIIPWSLAAGFSDPENGTAGTELDTDDADTVDGVSTLENVFADLTAQAAEDVAYDISDNTTGTQPTAPDGQHVDTSSFIIRAPELVLTKTSLTVWDPINGLAGNGHTVTATAVDSDSFDVWENATACTSSCPKAIPLAVVQYTIEIENTGSIQADDITITDQLDANTSPGVIDAGAGNLLGTTDATAAIDDREGSVASIYVDRCAAETATDSLEPFSGTGAEVQVTVGDCGTESAFIYYYVTIQ